MKTSTLVPVDPRLADAPHQGHVVAASPLDLRRRRIRAREPELASEIDIDGECKRVASIRREVSWCPPMARSSAGAERGELR